jgi:transposase-like protein
MAYPPKKKKRKPKPVGRPSIYSDSIARKICHRLQKGETITKICEDDDMPSIPTVFKWLNRLSKHHSPEFLKAYQEAREIQAEVRADESVDIADDEDIDVRSRAVRVETRKWIASHLLPRKFSSKMQLTGADDKPLIPERIIIDFGTHKPE